MVVAINSPAINSSERCIRQSLLSRDEPSPGRIGELNTGAGQNKGNSLSVRRRLVTVCCHPWADVPQHDASPVSGPVKKVWRVVKRYALEGDGNA